MGGTHSEDAYFINSGRLKRALCQSQVCLACAALLMPPCRLAVYFRLIGAPLPKLPRVSVLQSVPGEAFLRLSRTARTQTGHGCPQVCRCEFVKQVCFRNSKGTCTLTPGQPRGRWRHCKHRSLRTTCFAVRKEVTRSPLTMLVFLGLRVRKREEKRQANIPRSQLSGETFRDG